MAEVPTIDIAPLFGGDEAARGHTDAEVAAAVRECGGFVVQGFPGAENLGARAAIMLAFFELPEETKRAVATKVSNPANPRIYRGYLPSLEPDSWAHNEFYDIGPEDPHPGPPIPGMEILAETNAWPAVEPVPGWRDAMVTFYGHMQAVATTVMLTVGRGAGLSAASLTESFEGGNSTLRLLNYPNPPRDLKITEELPDPAGTGESAPLAAGRHTDTAGLSLLWQAQPGLQAQAPDGTWRDIPAARNAVSVHLGDVLESLTGGRLAATPHRVLARGEARQSIGFFLEPALDAIITPMATAGEACAGARGTYGWHLLRQLNGYQGYEALVPRPR